MIQSSQPDSRWYMVTVVGADRPGIVAAITDALFRAGCNLGEASMVRLGANFSVMLMVEGAGGADLAALLQPVTDGLGLRLHVDVIDGVLHHHPEPTVQITVHGADRPGIVAQVTGALAGIGFNILDLNSDVAGTPQQPIYVMVIDGAVDGGAPAVENVLAPLRAGGIEVRVTAIDTLIG